MRLAPIVLLVSLLASACGPAHRMQSRRPVDVDALAAEFATFEQLHNPTTLPRPLKFTKMVRPEYPRPLVKARMHGVVVFEIIGGGPDGGIQALRVAEATDSLFVEPAVEAIYKWRFVKVDSPDGQPFYWKTTVRMEFRPPAFVPHGY